MSVGHRFYRLFTLFGALVLAWSFDAATPSPANADRWNHRSQVKPKIHRFDDVGRYQRSLREYRLKRHSNRTSREPTSRQRHLPNRGNDVSPRFRPEYGRSDSRERWQAGSGRPRYGNPAERSNRRLGSLPLTGPGPGATVSATVAWEHLAEGRIGIARNGFATAAQASPQDGAPKVGFAISTAAGGDLIGGVTAMRRALRLDPGAVRDLKVDTRLTPLLGDIARRYQAAPDGAMSRSDIAFMLASLNYLSGDLPAAGTTIAGDQRAYPSTENLREIIETAAGASPALARTDGREVR